MLWQNSCPCCTDDKTMCRNTQSSVTLVATIFSTPQAERTLMTHVLPASKSLKISACTFLSSSVGSPVLTNSGKFRSSFVVPSSLSRLTSPVSLSAFNNWYSVFFTNGTLKLCEVGHKSSYFLPVKISRATMCAFACPCLPVFEVDTSVHLQGCPLIIKCDPFRISPACWGYVWDAPC